MLFTTSGSYVKLYSPYVPVHTCVGVAGILTEGVQGTDGGSGGSQWLW